MANRFFIVGGVDTNWGTTGNWASTSGGAGGQSVPTNADAVTLDASSGSACVINASSRACLSFTSSSFTGSVTFDAQLSVSGSITIGAAQTFAGLTTNKLRMIAAGTWTTNGVTIPQDVEIGGAAAFTCTLADALTITGTLSLTNTTSTTFSGAFAINAAAVAIGGTQTVTIAEDYTVTGTTSVVDATVLNGAFLWNTGGLTTTGNLSGSTSIVFNGTGTWTGAAGYLSNNLTINTAGVLSLSGIIRFRTGSITYVAGLVAAGNSTLSLGGSVTLDTVGMSWANIAVTTAATLTLSSLLTAVGKFTPPDAAVTFAGAAAFDFGTVEVPPITATRAYTFVSGFLYVIRSLPSFPAAATRVRLTASGGDVIVTVQRGAG